MRCRFCNNKAAINLRYARMALCVDHFREYFVKRVKDAINRYKMAKRGDKILVAVSGGKDSNSLLHVLSNISEDLGIEIFALHIDLKIGEYSKESRKAVEKLVKELNVRCVIIDSEVHLGFTLYDLLRLYSWRSPCSICGVVRRYLMNLVANAIGAKAIATGHHLDDIAPYVVKSFLLQDWRQLYKLRPRTDPLDNLAPPRIKPLVELSEKETTFYAKISNIPFYPEQCPHKDIGTIDEKIKTFLNMLEKDHPALKISLVKNFFKWLNKFDSLIKSEVGGKINACRECGMPADGEICAFCKLTSKIGGVRARLESLKEELKRSYG